MIGKVGPQGIYLVTNMILARFVTPEEFGMIGVLSIFFMIANTLMESGLGGSLIKEKHITDLDCSTIFVYNTVVSLTIYIILFFCAPAIQKYFAIDGLSTVCRTVSLVFVIASWGQIAQTLLFRSLQFKTLTITSIVSVVVASVVSIAMAVRQFGVYALVAYQLTQMTVYVGLNIYISRYKISFKFSLRSFKKLFSFGFFTTTVGVIESIYENLITFLFGKYLGIQKAGYLTQAKKVETASCNALVGTINSVSFPILARLAEKEDKTEFIAESHSILKVISLMIVPIILSIALYSDLIVTLLFGESWEPAGPYLKILVFVGIALIFETTTRNFLKSSGYVKELLVYTIVKRLIAICILAGCIFVNTNWLLYGYLAGALIGVFFNHAIYISKFSLKIWLELVYFVKILLPPFLLYVFFLLIVRNLTLLWVNIPIISTIYVIYYFAFLPKTGIDVLSKLHVGRKTNK